ncbi:diguanylate cyclase [Kutzneria sp. 744]|nr:diguanylate cyclase [Kutzneria sp. 744]
MVSVRQPLVDGVGDDHCGLRSAVRTLGDAPAGQQPELLGIQQAGAGDDSRFDGEEFAVLLPGVDREGLAPAAERIRAAVAALAPEITDRAGVTATVTTLVSVGAGLYPDHAGELSQLLLCVDAALYEARAAGRNGPCSPAPALYRRHHERGARQRDQARVCAAVAGAGTP